MWYFILKVSPKPNTELAKEAGGAYVNCWIDFREKEGAEHLAKFYLEQAGWNHEETQEASWVEKDDYEDDPGGMQNYLEAEADSGSFVAQQWGLNGEEEE
jgi:hypothetical protein